MPQVLIVGASRGIGLGLVHAYARRGWGVTGTVRDKSKAPDVTATGVLIESVDVTDADSRAALVESLGDRRFDAVILNAGVSGPRRMGGPDDEMLQVMHANAIGPAQLAWALLDHVHPQSGVIAFITSQMGSVADSSGGADTYRASKAAMNAYARSFFVSAAKPKGVAVLSLHPGWVQTDMGGPNAPLSVEESARGLADVISANAGASEHLFLDYSGRAIPW